MKKRIRKKEYKAILEAKAWLDTWDGDLFEAIIYGYINPMGRKTRLGRAIRKCVAIMGLDRTFRGWTFMMPSTSRAMHAKSNYLITISGYLYEGHTSFEECPSAQITVNMKQLVTNPDYLDELQTKPEYEMVVDLLGAICSKF